MTIEELKDALFAIISEYFPSAQTRWAEQRNAVKAAQSFLLLRLGTVSINQHPIEEYVDGKYVGYVPSSVRLEVQLFTHGKKQKVKTKDGAIAAFETNTALADIMDLSFYLTSMYADELSEKYDIAIRTEGEASDNSQIVDNVWEYRAMQEYVVDFMQTKSGLAGISKDEWVPTASGGGTKELADKAVQELDADGIEISKNFQ